MCLENGNNSSQETVMFDECHSVLHIYHSDCFCSYRKQGVGSGQTEPNPVEAGPFNYPRTRIYRGYSNFLLNMAFISPSEVEIIYIS